MMNLSKAAYIKTWSSVMNRYMQLIRLGCFILLTIVFTGTVSFAEIRYVKADSQNPAPPYTSWETASDSIQKCLDICNSGDTVYIGPGTYIEIIVMPNGISIIGSGMDTTIIDSRPLISSPDNVVAVRSSEYGSLSELTINVSYSNIGIGINFYSAAKINNFNYHNIKIQNAARGLNITNLNGSIKNCNILRVHRGISLGSFEQSTTVLIENNTIQASYVCIFLQPSLITITIRNNILMPTEELADGYEGTFLIKSTVYNNLVIAGDTGFEFAFYASQYPHFFYNNVVMNKTAGSFDKQGFLVSDNNTVVNNYIQGGLHGIRVQPGHHPLIKHNNSWNNVRNFYNFAPDSTNISADPMFVNPDSLDFQLQKFSPMIDAGDPEINDLDGSRSDIGLLGGPYGGFYEYIDLAPKIPKGFSAELLPKNILLRWNKNTEYDFSYYTIYRDTVSDSFTPDSSNLLGTIRDTLFIDNTVISSSAVYYKITAVDLAGNESPASPAASVITGMDGETAEVNNPDYRLYPNYPNPFNPSTTITYTLEKGGLVQLMVYDIQGQLVDVLVNKGQEAGVHKVTYTINNTDVPSGILMIRIQVKDDLNRMIYSEVIKALIIK